MNYEYHTAQEMGVNEIYLELDELTAEVIRNMARIAILRNELDRRNGKRERT